MAAAAPWSTVWDAYDVPRIWSMVRLEVHPSDEEHARRFAWTADLLAARHERCRQLRQRLVSHVDVTASVGLTMMLAEFDRLDRELERSANAFASTARALDRLMATLVGARDQIAKLAREWELVTTCAQDTWDRRAWVLNKEARAIMAEADEAIQDDRSLITLPRLAGSISPEHAYRPAITLAQATVPPALQGYPAARTAMGVPALPADGSLSFLPILPGHRAALRGGAYRLPGPRVGATGEVIQMPSSPGRRGRPRVSLPRNLSSDVLGKAFPVLKGVSPVIGDPASTADSEPDTGSRTFAQWFTDLSGGWLTFPDPLLRRPGS
ncbi:hypothetical protein [Allorhizocola rhizosphaerae]|uniref:hypothetical protein n=1 Tax=Allorhizocola rhizosphaerae TaxID=1872709 RepID=UPI000E3D498B|nr:hypothetical protein [Allorhizocola rhizosphaerae]